MKYIDEFRSGEVAQALARRIAAEVDPARRYHFMEFCGGHTHAISRYGIAELLPASVRMIHGPGCPVCVLPIGRIDQAIALALERGVMLCTYGDVMRVPASESLSLMRAKARGADIRMVYSAADALKLARVGQVKAAFQRQRGLLRILQPCKTHALQTFEFFGIRRLDPQGLAWTRKVFKRRGHQAPLSAISWAAP